MTVVRLSKPLPTDLWTPSLPSRRSGWGLLHPKPTTVLVVSAHFKLLFGLLFVP